MNKCIVFLFFIVYNLTFYHFHGNLSYFVIRYAIIIEKINDLFYSLMTAVILVESHDLRLLYAGHAISVHCWSITAATHMCMPKISLIAEINERFYEIVTETLPCWRY